MHLCNKEILKFNGKKNEFLNDHILEFNDSLNECGLDQDIRRVDDEAEDIIQIIGSSPKRKARQCYEMHIEIDQGLLETQRNMSYLKIIYKDLFHISILG